MTDRIYKASYILSIVIVPILLIVFAFLLKTNFNIYMNLTLEDNPVEWLTFIFLFLTAIFSFVTAIKARKIQTPFFSFFIVFSLFCFLGSLEEISWGQRVFGIESPEIFLEHNDQKEINIHNVIQSHAKNLSIFGINYNFKTKHLCGLSLFIYGTFLPLIAMNQKIGIIFDRIRIVLPPPVLSSSFFIAAIMMCDKPTGQEEELGELFFSICFFLFMFMEYLKMIRNKTTLEE